MSRTFAQITSLIQQMLQDVTNAVFDPAELGYWIEEGLKELSPYVPHIISVVFQIESRTGSDTAGTSSSLTDTTKTQFLSTDATAEKVVYNKIDKTWAVVETQSSTSVLTLNADIMGNGEGYAIFNKRCWNNKQIYIGDMAPYLWVESVEYPIGVRRNFEVMDEVLEVDVNVVEDSDSTRTNLANVDVLVRFAVTHVVSQLTDWVGELTADESKGDTTIAIDGFGSTETIKIGEEFHLENHRTLYKVTTELTLSSGAGNLSFYPPLEAAASDNDDITFRKSTLKAQHE